MTPIKYSICHILRGSLLRLRVNWHGNRLYISTGYHVDADKWDGKRCNVNTFHGPNRIPASKVNKMIESFEARINNAFYSFEAQDIVPDYDQLKGLVSPEKAGATGDIYRAIDEFIVDGERNSYWSHATGVKFRSKKHLLQKFNETARNPLVFGNINEKSLNEFVNWQTSHCISRKKEETNYRNSTILKNISFVKWFFRWARKQGYLSNKDSFEDYKPNIKTIDKTIVFLTWEELMMLYKYDFGANDTFSKVRDCFCFCCFTSLRYSDLKNLKKANIRNGSIHITTVKTTDTITIELNKFALAILDKYKDLDGDYALPVISSQKMNVYLKELGEQCGLDEPINYSYLVGGKRHDETKPKYELLTTHCARRTFICNALALGIPPNTVMEWTGHSNYASMQPYIAVANSVRKQSMDLFNSMPS